METRISDTLKIKITEDCAYLMYLSNNEWIKISIPVSVANELALFANSTQPANLQPSQPYPYVINPWNSAWYSGTWYSTTTGAGL
jgi:hypothetical protein